MRCKDCAAMRQGRGGNRTADHEKKPGAILGNTAAETGSVLDTESSVRLAAHAVGFDEGARTYRRNGKTYYKPYRNYFCTGRGTCDYPVWKDLQARGLADCSPPDKHPEDMEENLYYTLTDEGKNWLSGKLGVVFR